MTLGTFYLLVAVALIFAAGLVAARKLFRHLRPRIFAGMAMIALFTVIVIWTLLAVATRKPNGTPSAPATQPPPLLQSSPE